MNKYSLYIHNFFLKEQLSVCSVKVDQWREIPADYLWSEAYCTRFLEAGQVHDWCDRFKIKFELYACPKTDRECGQVGRILVAESNKNKTTNK